MTKKEFESYFNTKILPQLGKHDAITLTDQLSKIDATNKDLKSENKELKNILLDAWVQFGHVKQDENGNIEAISHYGLSTLELIYNYLYKKNMIYKNGVPKQK